MRTLGFEFAVQQLPAGLLERVISTIWNGKLLQYPSRIKHDAIQTDAGSLGLDKWLALDDDAEGWPEEQRYRLIAPNNA